MTPQEEAKLQRQITAELAKQANYRKEYSESIEKWNEGVEKLRNKQKTIANLQKDIQKIGVATTDEEKVKLAILEKQLKIIERESEMLQQVLKDTNKFKVALGDIGNTLGSKVVGGFKNIDTLVLSAYGRLKSSGLFDMDKAIKQSALEMGVLSKEGKGYYTSITDAAKITTKIGVGIEELTAMQSAYSEQLGRNVMLTDEGYQAMARMSKATGLGAEGSAEMAANFENVGLSVEQTGKFVDESLKDTHKLGLNASKTMKNLLSGMKMLNKYSFKDGIKGLDRMAKITTKLGVGMEFAAGMSEKLFNVEGAVEMSAQLQVMGGEWAKLADPFHLMYMARNDMAGLTEELGKAAESSVHFAKETKSFEIGAMEMQRLRVVSEQTGVSLEELAQAGKNAAKFTKIKSQISFQIGGGKEGKDIKEFITNKAMFDASGKASIMLDGKSKVLSELKSSDRERIKAMMLEDENMQKRVEESRTFDETLRNTVANFKIHLLPILKGLDKLIPIIDKMVAKFSGPDGWGKTIEKFATDVGGYIMAIGKFIADNPIKSLIAFLTTKVLFDVGRWFLNGVAMGEGFNTTATPGGGGSKTAAAGNVLGKVALAANVVDLGVDAYKNIQDESLSTSDKFLKTLDENKGKIALGLLGGILAPFTGGLSIAAAAGIGATIGSAADTQMGNIGTYGTNLGSHDALVPSKPSSDFSKGRGIISGGEITPIDNKDDLLAMKKGGIVDKATNQTSQVMNVDFGDITINGRIEIISPGAPGLSVDLMKDPQFKREIARVVSSEVEKNRNGGKNKV